MRSFFRSDPRHSLKRLKDIREFTPSSWRQIIGVVPQDPILFTGTIASNIAYGNPDATREQIEAAAREANCEFVWGMPQGFDTESVFPSPPSHSQKRYVDFYVAM